MKLLKRFPDLHVLTKHDVILTLHVSGVRVKASGKGSLALKGLSISNSSSDGILVALSPRIVAALSESY